jgi:hypothetical protein
MPHLVLRGRRPRTPNTPRSLALRAAGTIVAGTALLAAAPTVAQASAAMPRPAVVPCDPTQLVNAITKANGDGSAVLLLARGCNYVVGPRNGAASQGGGIVNGGAMVLSGDRVTFNQASVNSGGILSLSPGTISLRFTRVAFNTPDNCNPQGAIAGCRN